MHTRYTQSTQTYIRQKHSCTSKYLYIYILFYVYECFDCVFVLALYGCMEAREGNRTRTVVTDSCELPFAHKELNPDPLYEHQTLRTDEPVWYFSQRINFENFNPKYNWSFRRDYFVCGLLLCVDYCVCGIMMLHVALTGLRQDLEFQNSPGSQVKIISSRQDDRDEQELSWRWESLGTSVYPSFSFCW